MGKQCGPYYHEGTVQHICFYKMNGAYYLRTKSSLTAKRVKKDPAFARTMQYAQLLGKASKIASQVYKTYPKATRQFSEYRVLTGKAMQLLKDGFTEAAALNILMPAKPKAASKKCKAECGNLTAKSVGQKVQPYHTLFTGLADREIEQQIAIAFADSS
jgi:hypothetical protein